MVGVVFALGLPLDGGSASAASSRARLCIERLEQNGSLNTAPTILSVRQQGTSRVLAHKRFDEAGSLCADLPRGRYLLTMRLAEPWARGTPLHWWTRTFPLDLRNGDARYVMTNPPKNDEFQAMITGRNGWHRLWSVQRVN
jgi:hypothetical protein